MNYKVLAFAVCVVPFACSAHDQKIVDTSFVPDKTNRAYTVMVEAGAKLLEFDIIRARVNAQEKALVATLQHETFTSTAGKALGVLGPLEQLAHGFDDVIPAFLLLQNSLTEAPNTDAAKTQMSQALQGLVALLAAPEVLHAVLPQPGSVGSSYRDAMTFASTATFAKTIQAIAHKKFMLHYCTEDQQLVGQQALPNDAHLFYGVIRQTVQNLFGEMMKVAVATPVNAQQAKSCSTVYFDGTKFQEACRECIDARKRLNETKNSEEFSAAVTAWDKSMKRAIQSVAKSRGVDSVIAKINHYFYVDPECDVTQEVIDLLNKEYVASKQNEAASAKPEQQESVVKIETQKSVEPVQIAKLALPPQEMLHQAILHDSADEVEAAVKAGADVNGEIFGKTPLAFSLILSRNKAFETLLNFKPKADETYIALAFKRSDFKAAVLLAFYLGTDLNGIYSKIKKFAGSVWTNVNNVEAILMLLKKTEVNFSWNDKIAQSTLLTEIPILILTDLNRKAMHNVAVELLQVILKQMPDINQLWSFTRIYSCAEVIQILLDKGANPNHVFSVGHYGDSWTPLLMASSQHYPIQVLQVLLDGGAHIDQTGDPAPGNPGYVGPLTPLALAMININQKSIEFLLERGASL